MTIIAERLGSVDRAGILAFRGTKSLQPARQLIRGVRRTRPNKVTVSFTSREENHLPLPNLDEPISAC